MDKINDLHKSIYVPCHLLDSSCQVPDLVLIAIPVQHAVLDFFNLVFKHIIFVEQTLQLNDHYKAHYVQVPA
jgi:hypothetical protein